MRCKHCDSTLIETETVKEGHTEQTLYECPNCGRTALNSRFISDREEMQQQTSVSINHTKLRPAHF